MQVTDPRTGAFLKMGAGRMASVAAPKWDAIVASMSPHGQRAFVEDQRQGPIARAGRGGGKSYGMGARYHRPSAAHPGGSSVFVTISAERSRDILLPGVWKLNEKFGLGIQERKKDNALVWPNGYRVLMRGCKDRSECNKRRGTPWVVAGWDECDSINPGLLEYDIHECVEPRLADYNGKWFAGGTPGAVLSGYWYKLSSGESSDYPLYTWDARTNPYIRAQKYFLDTLTRMQGVPERSTWPAGVTSLQQIIDNPVHWHLLPARFIREYLGRWVTDLRALIYKLLPKNSYVTLPIEPDFWTIGCDLGSNNPDNPDLDHAAITVACSNRSLPYVWIAESFRVEDPTVDSLAARLCQLLEKYPEAVVHLDSASAGKLIELTFKKMGIPVQMAIKSHKLRRIQLMQSGLGNGNIQLQMTGCMDLRHEATALTWNEARNSHNERCADDVWDSAHYAVMPHLGDYQPEHNPIEEGTKEWETAQEMADYEEALKASMGDSYEEAA